MTTLVRMCMSIHMEYGEVQVAGRTLIRYPGSMREISADQVVVAASGRLDCRLDEEAVILDPDRGVYYGLDPVGARIWSLVAEPRTLGDILAILLEEYDVDRDRCERDLLELLGRLEEVGLVEFRTP